MFKKMFEVELPTDNEESEQVEDTVEVDEKEIIGNFPTYPSERLADLVVSYRYLGMYKNLSVAAMQELSNRRVAGDEFKYEGYIEKNLKELPEIKFDLKDLSGIMDKFKGLKKYAK